LPTGPPPRSGDPDLGKVMLYQPRREREIQSSDPLVRSQALYPAGAITRSTQVQITPPIPSTDHHHVKVMLYS
jgi:hypothetical protein